MGVITEMTHLTPYDLRRMLSNYGWQPSHIWISGAELWRHQHYEFSDVHIPVGKTALDRECFQNMMERAVSTISYNTKIPVSKLLKDYVEIEEEPYGMTDITITDKDGKVVYSGPLVGQPRLPNGTYTVTFGLYAAPSEPASSQSVWDRFLDE